MPNLRLAVARLCLIIPVALLVAGQSTAIFSATTSTQQPTQPARQRPSAPTIVGGRDANVGEYPWQVLLSQGCGGSLIAAQWVLTAAHCVLHQNQVVTNFQIYLGAHDLSQFDGNVQIANPAQVIPHPNYASVTAENDLALIKLTVPATLNSRVAVIGLATSEDSSLFAPGTLATVTGWGALFESGPTSDILQTVAVPIVSNQTCNAAYQDSITDNMLCAGYAAGGKDACQGDSGGPLIVEDEHGSWKQAGIVSFGTGCAEPQYYGVYTHVARYTAWINDQIGTVTPTPTPVGSPALRLSAESGVTGIFLDWQPAAAPQVVGYRVLRATANLTASLLNQVVNTDYHDNAKTAGNQLTPGEEYCYTVEAVDSQANLVASSQPACAIFGQLSLSTVDTQVQPGTAVTVPITIRNATDLRISQSAIMVNYDANLLSYQAVTSTVFTLGYQWVVSHTIAGQLAVQAVPDQPSAPPALYGDGALFALTFNAIGQAEAQSPLALQAYSEISQTGSTLTALRAENDFFDVPLALQGSVVRLADQPGYFRGDVNGDGTLTSDDLDALQPLVVADSSPSNAPLAAGDVNSNGQLDAGDAALLAYRLTQGTWPPVPAPQTSEPLAARLQLTPANASAGEVLTTTLQATDITGIAAGEFSIVYDPTIVERIVAVQSPLANTQIRLNDSQAGLLALTLVTTTPISGQQTLLTIRMKLRANAPLGVSPLQLADASLYDLNGRDIVRSFANQSLTRQSTTLQVQPVRIYLPLISR